MNERPLKAKKQSMVPQRPSHADKFAGASALKPRPACQPKPQPNIAPYSQYCHPRRPEDRPHDKENRSHNDPHASTRDRPRNVLLHPPRKTHHPDDPPRKTQKRGKREGRGREWVSVEEGGVGEGLGCSERLGGEGISRMGSMGSCQVMKCGGGGLSAE